MKVKIYTGKKASLMTDVTISRALPNPQMNTIGSIAFLDHVLEMNYEPKKAEISDGNFAHPHRGIATFSYMLEGGVHHLDSAGGEGKVYTGGIQWMNAGNGIIHDEFLPYDFQESGGKFHALQFWLNLPAKQKMEKPEYMAVQGIDVPEIELPNDAGKMRILLGEYQGKKSIVPTYLDQYIFHIQLKPGAKISLPANNTWEYGLYAIQGEISLEDSTSVSEKQIAELFDNGSTITLKNESNSLANVMLFGGEPYTEPIVPYGPFIMNSDKEISEAYSDYQSGKYGKIDYSNVKL